jgi:hypothetical protein
VLSERAVVPICMRTFRSDEPLPRPCCFGDTCFCTMPHVASSPYLPGSHALGHCAGSYWQYLTPDRRHRLPSSSVHSDRCQTLKRCVDILTAVPWLPRNAAGRLTAVVQPRAVRQPRVSRRGQEGCLVWRVATTVKVTMTINLLNPPRSINPALPR